jgi:hypothetical protein
MKLPRDLSGEALAQILNQLGYKTIRQNWHPQRYFARHRNTF